MDKQKKSFKELKLSQGLLDIINNLKFNEPSEIQYKTIPLALDGKDIVGESATGSGKTLAFAVPIIERISSEKGVKALILTPTRELTEQVLKSFLTFSKHKKLNIISIYGGVSFNPQAEALEKADIVVGTPGRILDHLSRNTFSLSKIKFLVLDEADRMLDMGFFPDVNKIINHCNKDRQTLLFSATISSEVINLSKKYMKNPVEVHVNSYVDPSKLKQYYYDVLPGEKFSLLIHLLNKENSKLVMVFCNTKRNTDFIGSNLKKVGFNALSLHGDLTQQKRNSVLEQFHKSSKFILVCTDVAARGLDIPEVSHVYNYDCPKTSDEYLHRIGRTARAGKEGKAVTILSSRDHDNFRRVIKNRSLKIESLETPEIKRIFVSDSNKDSRERSRGSGYSHSSLGGGYGSSSRSNSGRTSSNSGSRYGSSSRSNSGRTSSNSGSRYDSSSRSNSGRTSSNSGSRYGSSSRSNSGRTSSNSGSRYGSSSRSNSGRTNPRNRNSESGLRKGFKGNKRRY